MRRRHQKTCFNDLVVRGMADTELATSASDGGGDDNKQSLFRQRMRKGLGQCHEEVPVPEQQSRRRTRGRPNIHSLLWLPMLLVLVGMCPCLSEAQTNATAALAVDTPTLSPSTLQLALEEAEEGEEEREEQQQQETVTPTDATSTSTLSFDYNDFPKCSLTTQEMIGLNATAVVKPCILFDIQPKLHHIIPHRTTTITIVQVTPARMCRDARDGATTSIELLNAENNGRGLAVGFNKDYHIQFRFVSLVAGNSDEMGQDLYGEYHSGILTSAINALGASYIVGSCSFTSSFDKPPALQTQTMVLAQVGPPGYYQDEPRNPYVFGVHINSDEYPIPAVRALGFSAVAAPKGSPQSLSQQPVVVIYRTHSEFFRSTCESAVRTAYEFGFTNVTEVIYDPEEDHDEDGVFNHLDEDFLIGLADDTCPPGSGTHGDGYNPAIFACFLGEQDVVLNRWKENGCRPISMWLTAATWGWAATNPTVVPYMQGGGQWHEAFLYSDRFFESGQDVLLYNEEKFGYFGSYDTVVAYTIPMICAQHMETFYRVVDDPDPETDFHTEEGYERLRRAMVVLNTDTIFGPVSYNEDQRNVGRGAAGTQWQMQNIDKESEEEELRNLLVSPSSQAEAIIILPAPSAVNCTPGKYVNESLVISGDAILGSKCDHCPVDTFTAINSQELQCQACPEGSTTDGETGGAYCIEENDNLLSAGTLAFGYFAAGITWILSISFVVWLIRHRRDPVVLLSQLEFMILVCLGACISSSTIFALSVQAGSDEDTDRASRACQTAPFLYVTGWVLQYASLSAKSFRLHQIMNNPNMRRVKVTVWKTASVVAGILALDWIVVITWMVAYPLEYVREVISVEVDDVNHVTTVNTRGSCAMVDGPSMWAFVGPIIAIHALLMVGTNIILYKIRTMSDRYQEHKYVALASVFVCEVLVIGLPVIISVNDNPVAVFIVLSGIIALNDIGMLCFVFLPKVMFRKKGVQEGVSFGETILKATHKRAEQRESMMRSQASSSMFSMRSLQESSGPSLARSGSDCSNNRSSFEKMPSIIDDENEFEEILKEEKSTELKLEQAARKSWKLKAVAAEGCSLLGGTEDESSDSKPSLEEKYEEVKLKNYQIEMEMTELREREEDLLSRVQELEHLLVEKGDDV